ncbi:MAG: hypothetical protein QXQ46_05680 [Thermoplasmatales archaeon]
MSLHTEPNNRSGFNVKLANPMKVKMIGESRMKNEDIDSEIPARMLVNNRILEYYVQNKKQGR